jgi:hypothetical protein
VGVSVAYAALLLRTRRAVLDGRATALTEALGFLVRSYTRTRTLSHEPYHPHPKVERL